MRITPADTVILPCFFYILNVFLTPTAGFRAH
uniref:Uncharacterized protein n=1 Tax=Anguilla anguilla TaxID=7936 RepID=A0A0E9PUY7_ANGAN